MKKVLSVTLALLLLLPLLLLPASAAEPEEYVFEYMEPVMPLVLEDDFDYSESRSYYYYPGIIPDGYYRLVLFDSYTTHVSSIFYYSFDEVYEPQGDFLSQAVFENIQVKISDNSFSYYALGYVRLGVWRVDFGELTAPHTEFALCSRSNGTGSVKSRVPWKVKLVPSLSPACDSLVGSLSVNPKALFNNIISLLPVVLPVLVGFIGIRKAISYVRSKVSQA